MNGILLEVMEVFPPYLKKTKDGNYQLQRELKCEYLDSDGCNTGNHLICALVDHDALNAEIPHYITADLSFAVEEDESGRHQVVYAKKIS